MNVIKDAPIVKNVRGFEKFSKIKGVFVQKIDLRKFGEFCEIPVP